MEYPMDLRSTSLSCIFDALFRDTPFGHIFFAYAHMPIFGKLFGEIFWAKIFVATLKIRKSKQICIRIGKKMRPV